METAIVCGSLAVAFFVFLLAFCTAKDVDKKFYDEPIYHRFGEDK